jgi:hypothetical protein
MNTLQVHIPDYDNGFVSELGFSAISDAEAYGAASSIRASGSAIARLWQALANGRDLKLFCREGVTVSAHTEMELKDWCTRYFPISYSEYLRRAER